MQLDHLGRVEPRLGRLGEPVLCTLFVQCTGAMAAGKLSQSFLLAVTPTRAGLQLVTNGSLPSQFLIRSADPPQELRFEAPAQ